MEETISQQNAYLEGLDLEGYTGTVDPEYFQSGVDKERLAKAMSELISDASSVAVKDRVRISN